jgi:hypothetical protein
MPPLPGGVPERPKGTGCKPVGSAYGGSNPPAPTFAVEISRPVGELLDRRQLHALRPIGAWLRG